MSCISRVRICISTRWRSGPITVVWMRAVIVGLGRRDVVLEAARHHRPFGVHDAQRPIALLDIVDDDAEAEDVGQLLEGDVLALHLAPDRIGLLLPPAHLGLDAASRQLLAELVLDGLRSARRWSRADTPAASIPSRRLRASDLRTPGPPARRAGSACPCARPAAHRCPSSPRRCGGAFPASR